MKLVGKTIEAVAPESSRNYFTVTFTDGTYAALRKDGFMLYPAAPKALAKKD